jgi:2-hydroxy-3-oxopropionate reductase
VAEGARSAGSPREVAGEARRVITMLPDSPQVEEVLAGPNGVLAGSDPGALAIDMSTISPVVSRRLVAAAAERGVGLLDAPVSGGDVGARDGTLTIMVGGSPEDVDRARDLLEVLGETVTHVGASGAGQVVKACNQIVVALTIEAVSEALVLAERAGVEPALMLDVLGGGLAANKVLEVRRRNFLERDFRPGFRAELHHKDLGIALATARAAGAVLPVTAIVEQLLQALRSRGRGAEDHTALLAVLEGAC